MELVESQPDEKEMSEIDAARVPGNIFEDPPEHGSGDFTELRKQETEGQATPPRASKGIVAQIEQVTSATGQSAVGRLRRGSEAAL